MANSLIARCPKCSTAFRVSDEVLNMAKGKVRCGQCFHIFDAQQSINLAKPSAQIKKTPKEPSQAKTPPLQNQQVLDKTKEFQSITPTDENVSPDWLNTLFNDDDLSPLVDEKAPKQTEKSEEKANKVQKNQEKQTTQKQNRKAESLTTDEPAPWELELAEVEAALKSAPPIKTPQTTKANSPSISTEAKTQTANTEPEEPDYMEALHSLAQTASEQKRPSDMSMQHSVLEQISAQENLAPLLGEEESQTNKKSSLRWLWVIGTLLGLILLALQATIYFFDTGSRSANFRSLYKTICTYYGCSLPQFEDVSAITIQHVRIQSHPSIPNTLLVNAIITNTSNFSQSMPKIALEFFDLNGAPVAARLFSPSDYLHRDFLDITYMPPNTPIHLVIPIQDPGARAVTHQLRAFPAETRSY